MIEECFWDTDKTILMASHNFFISETLNRMLRLPEPEPFRHDDTGMTLMRFDKSWSMEFCNRKPDGNKVSHSRKM